MHESCSLTRGFIHLRQSPTSSWPQMPRLIVHQNIYYVYNIANDHQGRSITTAFQPNVTTPPPAPTVLILRTFDPHPLFLYFVPLPRIMTRLRTFNPVKWIPWCLLFVIHNSWFWTFLSQNRTSLLETFPKYFFYMHML